MSNHHVHDVKKLPCGCCGACECGYGYGHAPHSEPTPPLTTPSEPEAEVERLKKRCLELMAECATYMKKSDEAQAQVALSVEALRKIGNELGVPQPGYIAPVYNACIIVQQTLVALGHVEGPASLNRAEGER